MVSDEIILKSVFIAVTSILPNTLDNFVLNLSTLDNLIYLTLPTGIKEVHENLTWPFSQLFSIVDAEESMET